MFIIGVCRLKTMPVCKRIDSSSSLFSSVSRRMTSLIFGGSQLNKNNQVSFVSWMRFQKLWSSLDRLLSKNFKCSLKYPDSNEIYCLVDKNLEKWRINSDNTLSVSCLIGKNVKFELTNERYGSLEAGHSSECG